MIYTKNDITEGTIFENPYDRDQLLKVHKKYDDHFISWTTTEPHERLELRYDEVKKIRRVNNKNQ